ncbi:MAG: hypothetical protein BroJett011_59260 [Chloroflexota bacterium]|nr:MAG: hypothetical protein BroJett011_59260 [Chloroflexota bacterium]
MILKRYFYWVAVGIMVGFLSGLWLVVQSKADDPDPKLGNQVFLPFITTDGSATNADNITFKHIQVAQSSAAGGRIDAFTFFIPFAAESMAAQFDAGSSAGTVNSGQDIVTTISIAVNRDGTVIYYDQWEDALEGDLTLPTQTTTLVWGDGDPSNNDTGLAPGVQPQGIPANDILTAGTVITLINTVPSTQAGRGTPPTIFFDGGDMLTSVGGAIAVSTTFWTADPTPPNNAPGILYTDAWELYPTNRWGVDYIIPIGQNVNRAGPGDPGGFEVVGLNVQAVENNTQVEIDLNNDGTPEFTPTLDQGEQISVPSGVLAGARVRAINNQPVQVHLFASDPDSRYEARGFTMVPFEQWTNDYLAPRASDGDIWLYNPNANDLPVSVTTITGTTVITIPAGQTSRFPLSPAPLLGATGVHFTAPANFYGITALDINQVQDWGYALLPTANLTSQTLIGLGLGNVNSPGCPQPPDFDPFDNNGRESRIYVTSLSATTLFVDVNNDGIADTVDIDGDGVADPYPGPGIGYPLLPLQELSITDPTDCDMTGAFIFTPDGTSFASAWGQDQNAFRASPSIDAGTSIVPLRSLALQKTFTLLTDVDCTGGISVGDDVRFQLQYINDSATLLNAVTISDTLPAALAYIPNTTTQNGFPVADNSGISPYPLDGTGLNTGPLVGFSDGVLTYDAAVNNASAVIINRASASSPSLPLQGDAVTIFVPTGNITPVLQITETLIAPTSGPVSIGQVVTFSLTITNTGSTTVTTLPVQQNFNASYLTFLNAVPAPTITTTGVITWDDLTNTFGDLQPTEFVNLTISFIVSSLPPTANNTSLAVTVRDALRQNSPVPLTCSSNVNLNFAVPTPTPTPTSTPTSTRPSSSCDDCQGNGDKEKTPTPTPITVAVVPVPSATVLPPVTFLPETGLREAQVGSREAGIALLALAIVGGLGSAWLFRRRRRK